MKSTINKKTKAACQICVTYELETWVMKYRDGNLRNAMLKKMLWSKKKGWDPNQKYIKQDECRAQNYRYNQHSGNTISLTIIETEIFGKSVAFAITVTLIIYLYLR